MVPFLKWPGGKRWLSPEVTAIIQPMLTGTYFEPFLGGGAVFFRLLPRNAVLSDLNADLINTYQVVRESPERVRAVLEAMIVSKEMYYRIRAEVPEDSFQRAVRFLYLNRTAFGGMYRLNADGKFNVPYGGGGRTPASLWRQNLLSSASAALRLAELQVDDFANVMERAGPGDAVYCDPTYTVAHASNGFVRYNERNFSWQDQVRLAEAAQKAAARGALVVVSNAYHSSLIELYAGVEMRVLERPSLVSRTVSGRGKAQECLFILHGRSAPVEQLSAIGQAVSG